VATICLTFFVVLNPRPWNIEYLLQMLSGLMICLAAGMLLRAALLPAPLGATGSGKIVGAIIHVTFFNLGGFLCIAWLLKKESIGWAGGFGLNVRRLRSIGIGLGVALVVTPLAMIMQGLLAGLLTPPNEQPNVQEVVKVLQQTVQTDHLVFYGLVAIVLAPVMEELLFRGVFYTTIKARGYPRLALWGTSLLFALVHSNLLTFLPLTMLAMVLVWLYERTGNLLASIAAHSCFNSINFFMLVFRDDIHRVLQSN